MKKRKKLIIFFLLLFTVSSITPNVLAFDETQNSLESESIVSTSEREVSTIEKKIPSQAIETVDSNEEDIPEDSLPKQPAPIANKSLPDLMDITEERLMLALKQTEVKGVISDSTGVRHTHVISPQIRKQITLPGAAHDEYYHVFAKDSSATNGEGGFVYRVDAIDVKSSDDAFRFKVHINQPEKKGGTYHFEVSSERLKHIYKQKEDHVTVSFKIKIGFNYLFRKGTVSNWWTAASELTSREISYKIPVNKVAHPVGIMSQNMTHSPERYQANFPNGSIAVPIKPMAQEELIKKTTLKFIDEKEALSVADAIAKDPALSYTLFFEENHGDNTFGEAVNVTTEKNWQNRIPWDKLTNNQDAKAHSANDFTHKLTFNLVDKDYPAGHPNRITKKTVRLSLINRRGPDSNHNVGGPGDVKAEVSYTVGEVVPMSQIFKDAGLTSKNISDSWFTVPELRQYFAMPSLIESSGILKINEGYTKSPDPTLPNFETASLTMEKVGKQGLNMMMLDNPIGNDERLLFITIKVNEPAALKVIPYDAYTFNLGREISPKAFIKEVQLAGKVVPESDYEVELVNQPAIIGGKGKHRTQFVSAQARPVTLKVTYKGDQPVSQGTQTVQSAVKVNWGHTSGSYIGYQPFALYSAVISLLDKGSGYELVPTFGEELTHTHSYTLLRPNGKGFQHVLGLYGKSKGGNVDLSFERLDNGEPPIKDNHKLLLTGGSRQTIEQYKEAMEEALANVKPELGDVLAAGNRVPSEDRPNFHTKGNNKVNHSTKWQTDSQTEQEWSRQRTELYELTRSGLRHLKLNHFRNDPSKTYQVSSVDDLSSDKLLRALGEHRDGTITFNGLDAKVVDGEIDWTQNTPQKVVVQVREALETGGYGIYDYDINVQVELKGITVKHVYLESGTTSLDQDIIKDQEFIYDGKTPAIQVDAPDLTQDHYHYRKMMLDNQELGPKESYKVSFGKKHQTVYIMYQGESWVDDISHLLVFKGTLGSDAQQLTHKGEEPLAIHVKSTAYSPDWSLVGKHTGFREEPSAETIDAALIIDSVNVTQAPTVVHRSQERDQTIYLGKSGLRLSKGNKKTRLFVGENSYLWGKVATDYQSAIHWSIKDHTTFTLQTGVLPLEKVGEASD